MCVLSELQAIFSFFVYAGGGNPFNNLERSSVLQEVRLDKLLAFRDHGYGLLLRIHFKYKLMIMVYFL